MARIPAELGLTAEELDQLMTTAWNMRVATIGPGGRINLTPLWFGWAAGRVYFFGRGQKIANLRRSPACTVLVDRNEQYAELEGAMFQGHATVLETAEQEEANPHLEEVRWLMGAKYIWGTRRNAERRACPVSADGERPVSAMGRLRAKPVDHVGQPQVAKALGSTDERRCPRHHWDTPLLRNRPRPRSQPGLVPAGVPRGPSAIEIPPLRARGHRLRCAAGRAALGSRDRAAHQHRQ